jgi:hypothetical protein
MMGFIKAKFLHFFYMMITHSNRGHLFSAVCSNLAFSGHFDHYKFKQSVHLTGHSAEFAIEGILPLGIRVYSHTNLAETSDRCWHF